MHRKTHTLFEFNDVAREEAWTSVNDVVMGGISSSALRIQPAGVAVFEGILSLEHGGGFASVHSQLPKVNLSGYDGLEMRLRGDGKRYRARLRTAAGSTPVTYHASFQTQLGDWQSVHLPFDSFVPRFRGQQVPDAPPLDLASVTSFGWIIADGQAGRFRLEVDWVRAYVESAQ